VIAGKRVIVSGAESDYGRAVVDRLLEDGVTVHAADAALPTALGDVGRHGKTESFRYHPYETGQPDEIAEIVAMVARDGRIDGLVCCCSALEVATLEATVPQMWERILARNLTEPYLWARAVLGTMREAAYAGPGGASVVMVGSMNGLFAEPALAAYCAAKAGLVGLTRAIALDYGAFGVRCNCICPGYIDTPGLNAYFAASADPDTARSLVELRHPMKRIGNTVEVAAAVAFMLSDDCQFCTGQALVIDGGLSAGMV
jgi:NAD(P)-dependent dehydrogenase (short-subunit alcohol dehydrogenase family)